MPAWIFSLYGEFCSTLACLSAWIDLISSAVKVCSSMHQLLHTWPALWRKAHFHGLVYAAVWGTITVWDHLLSLTAAELGPVTSRRLWASSPSSAAVLCSLVPCHKYSRIDVFPALCTTAMLLYPATCWCWSLCQLWRQPFQPEHSFFLSEKRGTCGPHWYRADTSWFHQQFWKDHKISEILNRQFEQSYLFVMPSFTPSLLKALLPRPSAEVSLNTT